MAQSLKPDQIEDFKECFILHDKDGDGKISTHELGTVVRSLGMCPSETDIDELKRNFRGGSFGLPELMQVMATLMQQEGDREVAIRDAFQTFDRDGNGLINAAELRHIMTNIGEKLTEQEVDEMIREFDVDREGNVSYEDVVLRMASK
ncbi:hypothetical protein CAPTEDRAFT_170720 [Capitella teleta]|uniref:EF-hand domain-containing protein n=1 Tax=Capitella teleta TaxID=283909 RepID=R7UPI3_CAPTE|nr:hypothetical protein CAPTEDRAFT_170720 [Capitella teleta]|eukprot:ELU05331.1 hypothetical protein CAPTEDRAFT_170720 [Capitella teleta]